MKHACFSCEHAKVKSTGLFCTKYGIPIYQHKTFCVAFEMKKKEKKE